MQQTCCLLLGIIFYIIKTTCIVYRLFSISAKVPRTKTQTSIREYPALHHLGFYIHVDVHVALHVDVHIDEQVDVGLDMHVDVHVNVHVDVHVDEHVDVRADTCRHTCRCTVM